MTPTRLTPRAVAQGLGAARHGVSHWRAQRISAIALILPALWLVLSFASGVASDHATLTAWLEKPANTILMVLLLIAAFHHAALGFQVVVEDYIHSPIRFVALGGIYLACITGVVTGIVAVLRIAASG